MVVTQGTSCPPIKYCKDVNPLKFPSYQNSFFLILFDSSCCNNSEPHPKRLTRRYYMGSLILYGTQDLPSE